MATAISTTLQPTQSTDALFRLWAQWIHDLFSAAGFVQTTDTGQINLATVTKPAAAATSQGYEIWRFADTLQSTVPVFIKIEYGSGPSSASDPAIWITVTCGSTNGAGTLTGQVSTRAQFYGTGDAVNTYTSYGSGSGGARIAFTMFDRTSTTASAGYIRLGIERTKDVSGADNSDGVIILAQGSNGNNHTIQHQFLPTSGTIITGDNDHGATLAPNIGTNAVLGSDTYVYPIYPMALIPHNPGMNFMTYLNTDYTHLTPVNNVSVYGANHTYMPSTSMGTAGSNKFGSNTALRVMTRYE